jgi:hypothetical protein
LALDALKRAGLHPRTLEIDDFRYNKYVGYGWYIKVWGGVIIGGGESASSEWRGSIYGGDDGYRSESASLGSYEPKCGFILTAAGIIMAFVEPNPVALNYRPIAAALPDNGIYNCRPASDKELVQGIPQFLYSTDGNTDLEKAPIRWRKFFIDLIKTAAASQAGN